MAVKSGWSVSVVIGVFTVAEEQGRPRDYSASLQPARQPFSLQRDIVIVESRKRHQGTPR